MASFVFDSSIALQWFLEDEDDRANSLAILATITEDHRPVVPYLWCYEIANTILVQVRRQQIEFHKAIEYLNIIDDMGIDIDPPHSSAILRLANLAHTHNLTSYDTAFLELAMRLRLPLATNDKALKKAAAAVNVAIFRP